MVRADRSRVVVTRGGRRSAVCYDREYRVWANETDMASHDVGIGDFVLLDEITVERVVDNLKTRCVHSGVPTTPL